MYYEDLNIDMKGHVNNQVRIHVVFFYNPSNNCSVLIHTHLFPKFLVDYF